MAPSPPSGASSPPSHARPRTILVVDDEEDARQSLRDTLERGLRGVRVLTAASAAEGLAVLRSEPVDLVVSDYRMPGTNGLDFLLEVSKARPRLPRVMITAYPDLDLAVRAINDAGIDCFLTKPLEPEDVLEVAALALRERFSE